MTRDNERLELLLTRRLDGELAESEELELNKCLIRSPEAQRLARTLEEQDRLVHRVLNEWLKDVGDRVSPPERLEWPDARLRLRLRWWPAVSAAMLAVSVGVSLFFGVAAPRPTNPSFASASPPAAAAAFDVGVELPETPHVRRNAVSRDVIGILSEDGSTLYLLERNHTRTAVVPFRDDL